MDIGYAMDNCMARSKGINFADLALRKNE